MSAVYLKLPLFFSNDDLYSLCPKETDICENLFTCFTVCIDNRRETLRFDYPDLTVQRLVPLSQHKIRRVPHKAADTLQPIQVLLVLHLNRD